MKKIIVVVTYEAYIPEDMTIESLEENIDGEIRNRFDGFGVSSKNYHNEDDEWIVFDLEDVMTGTSVSIAIGNK